MRKVLFKAQRIANKQWVEGYLYIHYNSLTGRDDYYIRYRDTDYLVIPETVCEYTGEDDKHNNKIFEGDYWIDDEDYAVFVTTFEDAQYCFVIYEVDTNTGCLEECDRVPMKDFHSNEIEIIGNIHNEPKILRST